MSTESRYTLAILPDEDAPHPRRDMDHTGTAILAWTRKYDLGDPESKRISPSHYEGWDALRLAVCEEFSPVAILPLYLLDHSGLSLSTGPFGCTWDSGQIGWIVALPDAQWEGRSVEQIEECLRAEVETYHCYLSGDVWGYVIEDAESQESVESCWGYFGRHWAEEEGASMLSHWRQREAQERAEAQAQAQAEAGRIARLERIAEVARSLVAAACPEGSVRQGMWADLASALEGD